jgi:hypothetical protein
MEVNSNSTHPRLIALMFAEAAPLSPRVKSAHIIWWNKLRSKKGINSSYGPSLPLKNNVVVMKAIFKQTT